ncbi:MAG TPA: acyltransferase, partial [Acidimicrobiales bacterium]
MSKEPRPGAALVAGVGAVERSRNVDVLRALSALAVLFGHAYLLSGSYLLLTDRNPLHMVINNGTAGVWVFFALSGYLIGGPFIRALMDDGELRLRSYATRRVARIFPAYLVALAVVFAFGLTQGTRVRWWAYPLHAGLLHNLVPGQEQAILFASWTLSLEMLFYLFMPTVAVLVRRFHQRPLTAGQVARGIGALWAVSVAWTAAADHVSDPTYGVWLRFLIPSLLSMFCPGLLVALAVAVWRSTGEPPGLLRAIAGHRLLTLAAVAPLVLVAALGSTSANVTVYDGSRQAYAV